VDGEADAMVSRGLLAILCQVLSGQSPEQVLQLPSETITDRLGLRNALSKGRNDGLASMVRVVQGQIQSLLTDEPSSALATAKINSNSGKPTVAMLLSGGVDSSVALNLLHSQGYSVTAFYLKIWLEDELAHLGQCPWEDDYDMCIQVCNQAGVPLESISLQQEYKETVISYTVAAAQRGRTPNPDIMCNSRVKFGCFYDAIEGRGFDYVASGHYAQLIADDNGAKQLLRAPDAVKDQSYFLCALKQEQLQRVLFPIGHLEKHEVRQLAQDYDLPNKNRPDSQGLCFLGKVKFDEFLAAYLGESPGDIIDARTGEKIGRHNGVWYHTVGQRKGIGKVLDPKATAKGPWYVVAKDPEQRIVYASNEYDEEVFAQARSDFFVEDIHWISGSSPVSLLDGPVRLDMKIRHGPRIVSGSLRLMEDGVANVKLDQKDGGLAPGQYVVFYEPGGIECHGGAVISERHWARFLFDKGELDLALL
jgi:tRNA-specific 2-thiouridylase